MSDFGDLLACVWEPLYFVPRLMRQTKHTVCHALRVTTHRSMGRMPTKEIYPFANDTGAVN